MVQKKAHIFNLVAKNDSLVEEQSIASFCGYNKIRYRGISNCRYRRCTLAED